MISSISINNFKKINESTINLGKLNVLIGGNNAGKSCYLQGIHFAVMLSQSQRIAGSQQFPAEKLRYCPTDDFLNLSHERRLTEGTHISFRFTRGDLENAEIKLNRGRNGVVRAIPQGEGGLWDEMSNPMTFFSIYVPGLAGITLKEEYRSDLVVNNGIARGDANLYLRNVLLRINQEPEKNIRFHNLLNQVFPDITVTTRFDHRSDQYINCNAKFPNGDERPIDTIGTGFLQTVQLIAYATNYNPSILLLDEPDAHLNAKNQRSLATTFAIISNEAQTQIILATHSRHLIDAIDGNEGAKLFWVKDGVATEQEIWGDVSILMDLGALDRSEMFIGGQYRYLVWTEDEDTTYLETLLEANGFPMEETKVFSYQTSSKFDAAAMLGSFVNRIRPGVTVVIHRDRDFLQANEIPRLTAKYNLQANGNSKLFITDLVDIESHFLTTEYLTRYLGIAVDDVSAIINELVARNVIPLTIKFRDKRDDIKRVLYKDDPGNCPNTANLLPPDGLEREHVLGKFLLRRLNERLQQLGHPPVRGNVGNVGLHSASLQEILQ